MPLPPPTSPLSPPPPLRCRHRLATDDGHCLQVDEFGTAAGVPVLLLHGGPGSGSSPLLCRFFDAARYRVICPDQRGAGGSTPRGSTRDNRTDLLLADLRRLRRHLGVPQWLVAGGSWGATLALAHAADQPEAVSGLLLRSAFLARDEDLDWFFRGAAQVLPQAWSDFAEVAPASDRAHLLAWLARVFDQPDEGPAAQAARAWWRWERALAGLPSAEAPAADALPALIDRYRVQAHYLLHGCWLQVPTLLQRCEAVPRVPTLLLHSRDDHVCRPAGALALQAHLPHAQLHWVDGAGHDPLHPSMAAAMRAAADRFAATAGFRPIGCPA